MEKIQETSRQTTIAYIPATPKQETVHRNKLCEHSTASDDLGVPIRRVNTCDPMQSMQSIQISRRRLLKASPEGYGSLVHSAGDWHGYAGQMGKKFWYFDLH